MQTIVKHYQQQDCQTIEKDLCDSNIQTTKQDFDVEACCQTISPVQKNEICSTLDLIDLTVSMSQTEYNEQFEVSTNTETLQEESRDIAIGTEHHTTEICIQADIKPKCFAVHV